MLSKNFPRPRVNLQTALAMVAAGAVLGLSSLTVVRAEHEPQARTNKIFTCTTGTACVEGKSTGSAYGLYGTSSGVHGIYGQTTTATGGYAGVYGIATANGYGVYGASSDTSGNYAALDGYGANSSTNLLILYSNATKGKCTVDPKADLACTGAISGASVGTSAGVTGKSTSNGGTGVYGSASSGGYGVYGTSSDTHNFPAVAAIGTNPSTVLFLANDAATDQSCEIDANANLSCDGSITGDDVQLRQPTSAGKRVLAYAPKAASPTIEDAGTAQMVDGVANVHFEADFASTIEHSWYYVFLTPLGDTRGLYVSRKTPSGFQVRETERGRSTLQFDYRIVARPLGAKSERLPIAPTYRVPKQMRPIR